MADIKVTQDDREAAAKCHERSCYEIIRIQAVQCRNGYADGDYLVQTFARHRIEAEQRGAKKMRDAAAKILSLQSQLAAAQENLARAEKALAGLVTHPNDYHDCADDDLALILVRDIRRARTTLAALREPAAEEGRG